MKLSEKSTRPARLRLPDFAGRSITLPDNPESWDELLASGKNLLLLGLGPGNPASLPFVKNVEESGGRIFWLEDESTFNALAQAQERAIPQSWTRLRELNETVLNDCQIYFYRVGLRLAPDFWSPLLGELDARKFHCKSHGKSTSLWLPGNERQLLHLELKNAFSNVGFAKICETMPHSIGELTKSWSNDAPDFVLSVNFRGLDPDGRIFQLCQALEIPVAIWLVDNPWNLLSGVRLPWWKKANLFLTDASFIPDLRALGAERLYFCPLAASSHMLKAQALPPGNGAPLFVGRSSFPDHAAFFSGIGHDAALEKMANDMVLQARQQADLPDCHWWSKKYSLEPWPGLAYRKIGHGADKCSALNRARWLQTVRKSGLKLIGDAGWQKFLPDIQIFPPVDYYGVLAKEYRNAECVLNVTSLLLPHSLNQRHFDVWTSGGFLLSDATPGLEIFPEELVRPIVLNHPDEFSERLNYFRRNHSRKAELIRAWQELIEGHHLYEHRVRSILDQCFSTTVVD